MEIEKLRDELKALGKRVAELSGNITNEEQTKNAFILPFFKLLGYDIFNPLEFVPEFTADVGIKKGEKVDYAIMIDGQPQILIEAKSINEKLTKHDSQLFRYFGTTSSKFGILTNGKEYRFFTDLEEPNKMDSVPFLTIDVTEIRDVQVIELAKFYKANFDIEKITSSASELKYLDILKEFLTKNFDDPSEEFVADIVSHIYEGRRTQNILDAFKPIIKKGLNHFITDRVNEKLSAALNTSSESKEDTEIEEVTEINPKDEIITTDEELEAYAVVKVLARTVIDPERVFYRDNRSYFNVLLDDNIKKWIIRFTVRTNRKTIEIRDIGTFDIEAPIDITKYKEEIKKTIEKYQ